jgi:hypothetical protein
VNAFTHFAVVAKPVKIILPGLLVKTKKHAPV